MVSVKTLKFLYREKLIILKKLMFTFFLSISFFVNGVSFAHDNFDENDLELIEHVIPALVTKIQITSPLTVGQLDFSKASDIVSNSLVSVPAKMIDTILVKMIMMIMMIVKMIVKILMMKSQCYLHPRDIADGS